MLDIPQQSTSFPVGSTLTVLYDPANPSTVAWPGSGSGGGWAKSSSAPYC